MNEQISGRLQALESEYQTGQKILAELDEKRMGLTRTLLRIEGAMEVLREVMVRESTPPLTAGASSGRDET